MQCQRENDMNIFVFLLVVLIMIKGAVIFNAGYRGGRISKTNRTFSLPHMLHLITFATPFQGSQKFHTPLLSDLS